MKLNNSEFYNVIVDLREQCYSWEDIAEIVNETYDLKYSREFYRKHFVNNDFNFVREINGVENSAETAGCTPIVDNSADNDLYNKMYALKKERLKLSDELTQNNAYLRRIIREETIKEIALSFAQTMNKEKLLPVVFNPVKDANAEAILQLSDWHYGLEFMNAFNNYSTSVCEFRLGVLRDRALAIIEKEKIEILYIANLSDLIAGNIHLRIRLESRVDVISQTMKVSELMAELISSLSEKCKIEYFDCYDNHSRIEPKKTDSLDLESLTRITRWYLVERFKNIENVHINTYNEYGDDIINFSVKGWDVVGVHGDKDSMNTVVPNIFGLTKKDFDLALIAHKHHFGAGEDNRTIILENGSLMGTDTYAFQLRKSATPSQNLIVVSNNNPTECIYRIVV